MPTIYQLRDGEIHPDVEQAEGQITSYVASSANAISLIHEHHVQDLQDFTAGVITMLTSGNPVPEPFASVAASLNAGGTLDRETFLSLLPLADTRPAPEPDPGPEYVPPEP